MKWLWIILLIIIGIVAGVVAFEYLTLGIGHLPSWLPGHVAATSVPKGGSCPVGWHEKGGFCYKTGRKHKSGIIAAVIAVIAFVGAGWLIYKNQQAERTAQAAGTD